MEICKLMHMCIIIHSVLLDIVQYLFVKLDCDTFVNVNSFKNRILFQNKPNAFFRSTSHISSITYNIYYNTHKRNADNQFRAFYYKHNFIGFYYECHAISNSLPPVTRCQCNVDSSSKRK